MKKCTVMVKVPPGPWGQGRRKLSGEKEWRPRQTLGTSCRLAEGIAGPGVSGQRLRPKLVGSGMWGQKAATPRPSCLPSTAKVSAGRGKRGLRDRRQARLAGGGAQRKGTLGGGGELCK